MKNISYSLVLLSVFGHSGGDILPIEFNANIIIEEKPIIKIKVEEKEVFKEEKVLEKEKVVKTLIKTSKNYLGLSMVQANFDSNINGNVLKNIKPYGLMFKAGHAFVDNLALEARIGKGFKSDSVSTATDKWKSLYGIYLKPQMTIFDTINIFGLLGYSIINETVNGVDNRSKGVSYGLGTGYSFTKNMAVTLDAVRYASKNNQDSDAYSLGFEYKF
jgi:hypothetical protein